MFKVLVVTKTRTGGGTEKHVAEISRALNIDVAYLEDGFWQLWRRIKYGKYEIIHGFLPRPYLAIHIACWLSNPFRHHCTIFMSRRSLTGCYQTPLIRFIEKFLHKRTKVLVGNSPAVVRQLRAEAPKSDIRLIRNGITISPMPRRKSSVFTMVTVANAFGYKGYDDLMYAMAIAGPKLPEPWRLMLIGRGVERYKQWRVEPLGFLPADAVREWLAKADLFILPSREEGSSNALLEAMACGVPVIATSVGGNRDAISHGNNGLLTPLGNRYALAKAILWAAHHPIECQAMAYQAKVDVNLRFSFDRCISDYKALYSSAA